MENFFNISQRYSLPRNPDNHLISQLNSTLQWAIHFSSIFFLKEQRAWLNDRIIPPTKRHRFWIVICIPGRRTRLKVQRVIHNVLKIAGLDFHYCWMHRKENKFSMEENLINVLAPPIADQKNWSYRKPDITNRWHQWYQWNQWVINR